MHKSHIAGLLVLLAFIGFQIHRVPAAEKLLTINRARVTVTGHDVNPPGNFPGWGGFNWPGNISRLDDGELLMVHSAGYWHVSFAEPRLIEPKLRKRWLAEGWPLNYSAPTGGRCMMVRSRDGGKSWSKPNTILDLPLDDGAYGLLRCHDGTLLCFVNVQASWYGFDQAPKQFRKDIAGLNTRQCVIRSVDGGVSWSKPVWLESPGRFYERSHAQPIQLPDGGILWPTYCADTPSERLFGVIHRSDDSGKSWRVISTIRRQNENVDEPAIARLQGGRLMLVSRPDSGLFFSNDSGKTWKESGSITKSGRLKAPRMFVLKDGTVVCVCTYNGVLQVFLSKDDGVSWSSAIPLDKSAYGYPGGVKLPDESLVVSYCQKGRAPSRLYVARFRVNKMRDGIELLSLGEKNR